MIHYTEAGDENSVLKIDETKPRTKEEDVFKREMFLLQSTRKIMTEGKGSNYDGL